MNVLVTSGKGGTDKTSNVGFFAALAKNKVLVDCDVDAADLHLLLQSVIREKQGADYINNDGPPGICCPVISSLSGARLALLVTQPTLSGIHDLDRVVEVCQHFIVPALVCVNKYDINLDNTRHIEDYCSVQQVDVIAKIPFDKVFTYAMIHGLPVVKYSDGKVSRQKNLLLQTILDRLTGN